MKPGKRVYASNSLEFRAKSDVLGVGNRRHDIRSRQIYAEFAEWATAKGLTATDLQNNPKLMEQGSDYAMKQLWKQRSKIVAV